MSNYPPVMCFREMCADVYYYHDDEIPMEDIEAAPTTRFINFFSSISSLKPKARTNDKHKTQVFSNHLFKSRQTSQEREEDKERERKLMKRVRAINPRRKNTRIFFFGYCANFNFI